MRKYLTVLAATAAVCLLASGTAGAATVAAPVKAPAHLAGPVHLGPGGHGSSGHHHHWHQNCNNDPDSEFAMDPDVCPPSNNADAYDDEDRDPGER